MNKIIDVLYHYARGNGMEYRCLQQIPEYREMAGRLEPCLRDLEDSLSPEQKKLLERYLEMEQQMASVTAYALFQCGLSVGLQMVHILLP